MYQLQSSGERLFKIIDQILGEMSSLLTHFFRLRSFLHDDNLGGEDGRAVIYHFQYFFNTHIDLLPYVSSHYQQLAVASLASAEAVYYVHLNSSELS